eukprot:CAMPEP_0181111352 /NCGR_PEP_ID=MMETSP1071-20121207/19226_1 /TAXON_ID=35127 /ORGANISM="Thalassiosira sp., Strain NH16" /LENGTH=1073 /DNA_ID=CAMNT_0023195233 /DNA_START=103 /DNA_END=3322 /DNA_ORIENTATION=+
MPRSKSIFGGLSGRLRGRSRSTASRKGRRLKDDDDDGGDDVRNTTTTNGRAASVAVATADGFGSTSTSKAAAPQSRSSGRAVVVVVSPENRGARTTPADKSPTAAAVCHDAATASTHSPETPPAPVSPAPPALPDGDDDDRRSRREEEEEEEDDDDERFTSAFTRSPPSFDNFDSGILDGVGGVFPQSCASPGDDDDAVRPNDVDHRGQIGPDGMLQRWGDADVNGNGSGSMDDDVSAMLYSQDLSGSVDPPAILMLDDDDEEEEDEDDDGQKYHGDDTNGRHPRNARRERIDNPRHGEGTGGNIHGSEWFDHACFDNGTERNENRRLVSPSPAKPSGDDTKKQTCNDDLAAWGGSSKVIPGSTANDGFDADVFGTDFFDGFDATGGAELARNDDGFGAADRADANDDAFFGNSWKDANGYNDTNKTPHFQLRREGGSDPWGESQSSFATPSFNYSISNSGSMASEAVVGAMAIQRGVLPTEEKKDDPPPTASSRQSAAAVVWDDPGPGDSAHNATVQHHHPLRQRHHPLEEAPSSSSQRQASQSRQEGGEVVVTFDGGLPLRPGLSAVVEERGRKAPPSHDDRNVVSHPPPATARIGLHRRLNSNGSQSSRKSGLSQHNNHRRSIKKSGTGGSVGSNRSNSSAVDQILEHYRQKRRGNLAGAGNNGRGGGGSVSVHSGAGQFGNNGSSPGSCAPGGAPGAVKNGSRGGPGGSGQTTVGVPAGYGRHRRNPSNESVSRIIDNLGNTATSGSRSVSNGAAMSPQGKHYPPNRTASSHSTAAVPDDGNGDDIAASDRFLLANIEATIGPRGVAPDMESLSGRSSVRSHHLSRSPIQSNGKTRPQRSPSSSRGGSSSKNNNRRIRTDTSVDSRASRASRASRNSFRTYQSTRSALSHMSKESQSVANDLFRLEAQLADQVARQQRQHQEEEGGGEGGGGATLTTVNGSPSLETITYSTSAELGGSGDNTPLGAKPVPRSPEPFQIVAPPGKLGILLSNSKSSSSTGGGPTHVSAVRSESVLAGKVHVGDIFVSIDGENVTRMNSKEITNIMARKAEFERVLKFRPLVSGMPVRQEW